MARIEDCPVGTKVRHRYNPAEEGTVVGRRAGGMLEGYTVGMEQEHVVDQAKQDRLHVELVPPVPHGTGHILRIGCQPEDVDVLPG